MDIDEFASLKIDPQVKAVILGINKTFNFRKLAILSMYLQKP